MDKQVNISSEKIYKGKCYPYLLKVFIIFSALAIVAILLLTSVGIYRIYTYHIIRDAETDAINIGYMIFGQEKDVLLSRDSEGETQVFVSAEDIPSLDCENKPDTERFRDQYDKEIVHLYDYYCSIK